MDFCYKVLVYNWLIFVDLSCLRHRDYSSSFWKIDFCFIYAW